MARIMIRSLKIAIVLHKGSSAMFATRNSSITHHTSIDSQSWALCSEAGSSHCRLSWERLLSWNKIPRIMSMIGATKSPMTMITCLLSELLQKQLIMVIKLFRLNPHLKKRWIQLIKPITQSRKAVKVVDSRVVVHDRIRSLVYIHSHLEFSNRDCSLRVNTTTTRMALLCQRRSRS